MNQPEAILIAGPTASGKSGLASDLAQARNGVVINADSMQVYRELRILTARPTRDDELLVPHRLYGFIGAHEPYSVGLWLKDVEREIKAAQMRGLLPIIVGGSGLYLTSLIDGISPIPEIPQDIRHYWRSKSQRLKAVELHAILKRKDLKTAQRIVPSDRQRIVRALEVIEATGRSLTDWQQIPGKSVLNPENCELLVLAPDRQELYARCDRRFDAMVQAGVLDEVVEFMKLELDPDLPVLGALGLQGLMEAISKNLTFEEAVINAKTDTRRYAKRQMTWLKRNMIAWKWQKK